MGLAIVGIRVEVQGIHEAMAQFQMLEYSIQNVVNAAKGLKNLKLPSKMYFAAPGGSVFDQSTNGSNNINTKYVTQYGAAAAAAAPAVAQLGLRSAALSASLSKLASMAGMAAKTLATALGGALKFVASGLASLVGKALSGGMAIKSFGASLQATGRHIGSFGSSLAMLGQRLMGFISLPIIAMFKLTADASMKLETEMVGLRTLIGLSADEADAFKEGMMELVPALGIKPLELAEAGYTILSRGIRDTTLALYVLERAGMASAIGLGETEQIARIATATFISYGGAALDMADQFQMVNDIMDVFVVAVQRGAAEAEELVEPLGRSLGLASNLGIGIDELTANITTFTYSGENASEAVTAFNRVMASLLKPTKKSEDALNAIGHTTETLLAQMSKDPNGLAGTLIYLAQEFDKAGIRMSDFIGRIPGLNMALFLTGGAMDMYIENLQAIQDSSGALDQAFEIVQQSTEFQWKMLVASIQALGIAIGDILLPAINSMVQALLPFVANVIAFTKAHPDLVKMTLGFLALAAVIGPLVVGFGLFLSSAGAILTMIGAVIGVIGTLVSSLWVLAIPIGIVAATIAGLFAISLKDMVIKTVDSWDDMQTVTVEGADGMEEVAETKFQTFARHARAWGINVITQFAYGMAQAIIKVVEVLIQIGTVIRSWLQGHSPPKLLPELTDWGKNVIDTFLHGMTEGDFTIFNTISSTISSLFRSLGEDVMPEEDLLSSILGSREGLLQALNDGNLTAEILKGIAGEFGHVSDDVVNYALMLQDLTVAQRAVAEAQKEINEANQKYESQMRPLNKELEKFRRFGEELSDADRKKVLERRLKDPRTSELEKELILMDLRALEIKKQQQAITDERDASLEASNAKLSAAKAEEERQQAAINLQKMIIDAQIENNSLIREQIDLIERLNKEKKDPAAKAAAGGGGGPMGDPADPVDIAEMIKNKVGGLLTGGGMDPESDLGKMWTNIKSFFEPLGGEGGLLAGLSDVWSDVFLLIREKYEENKGQIFGYLWHAMTDLWEGLREPIWNAMKAAWGWAIAKITEILTPIWEKIKSQFQIGVGQLEMNLKILWATLLQKVMDGPIGEWWESTGKGAWEKVLGYFKTYIIPAFKSKFNLVKTILVNAWEFISASWEGIIKPLIIAFAPIVGILLAGLGIVMSKVAMGFDWLMQLYMSKLHPWMMDAVAWISEHIVPALVKFADWLQVGLPAAIQTASNWIATVLIPWFQDAWAWLGEKFEAVKQFFIDAWAAIGDGIQWVWDNVFVPFWDWLKQWWTDFKETLGVVAEFLDTVFLGKLRLIWAFVQDSIIPLFQAFWDVLTELWLLISTSVMTALTDLWDIVWASLEPALQTLWDILEDVWDILKNSLQVVLEALNPIFEWFKDLAISAWDAVEDLWGHLLKLDEWFRAVLVQVGDLLWETFLDKMEKLAGWFLDIVAWVGNLKDLFQGEFKSATEWWVTNVLNPMEERLAKVAGWVQGLIDIFGNWAAVLKGIRIPEDMDEHSPSPLERSLTNSRLAMEELLAITEGLQRTFAKKTMLQVGANVTDVDAAARAQYMANQANNASSAMQEYAASSPINIGPNSINNGMDMAVFEAMVRRAVARAIG